MAARDTIVGFRPRQSKEFASDFGIVNRSQERAAVREMSVKAIMRELERIAKGEVADFSREERKAAFGLLNELGRLAPSDQLKVREGMELSYLSCIVHLTIIRAKIVKEMLQQ